MISRVASLIAVLLVVVVSSVDAFSTQQHSSIGKTRHSQIIQRTTICFAEGDESNIDATNDEPKVAVKCPDCDLCDGSGRCVSYTINLCISYAQVLQITYSLLFFSLQTLLDISFDMYDYDML